MEQDGTLDKIEKLGIKVDKINASIGPIRHKFEGVPTFVINDKIYADVIKAEEITTCPHCGRILYMEAHEE